MFSGKQRVWQTATTAVVWCFIAFNFYCWYFSLAIPGETEVHQVGLCCVLWLVALLCSVSFWRSRRWFSVLGLLSCLLWGYWMLIPTL